MEKLHLRLQQRTTRKCVTTLEGINEEHDWKKIVRSMKKKFSCGGAIKRDNDDKPVLTLFGDQRENIIDYLVDTSNMNRTDFIIHG